MAHFWEGLYRTTRALFRLVGVPEPDHAELKELVKTVPAHAPRNCDALYDDVRPVINSLHNSGYVLGIISHALVEQARATLQGGRIIHYFQGPIIGPDSIGRLCKDRVFLEYAARKAQIPPSQCLVVDDDPVVISSAGEAGMFTVQVCRHTSIGVNQNTDHTCTELRGLLEYLRIKV